MVHLRLRICVGYAVLCLLSGISSATLVTLDSTEANTQNNTHTFSLLPTKQEASRITLKTPITYTITTPQTDHWLTPEPAIEIKTTQQTTQTNISSTPFAYITYKPL